jgi:hypothetical protein
VQLLIEKALFLKRAQTKIEELLSTCNAIENQAQRS